MQKKQRQCLFIFVDSKNDSEIRAVPAPIAAARVSDISACGSYSGFLFENLANSCRKTLRSGRVDRAVFLFTEVIFKLFLYFVEVRENKEYRLKE